MQATDPTSTTRNKSSDQATIFVSLELSRAVWLVTVLVPGGNQKMSRHQVPGGDLAGLLSRFAELQRKAQARTGQFARIVVIQEAGLDGFWIHRALVSEEIESYVVDPASIAASRRHRRAKTELMERLWFAPCWPTSAGSRASAPWFACRHQTKRTSGASAVS